MADPKFITAFIIVLAVDCLLLMGQFAIKDINPATNITFMSYTNNSLMVNNIGSGSTYLLNTSNVTGLVPGANIPVTTSTGDSFTDTFKIFRTWSTLDAIGTTVGTVMVGPAMFLSNPNINLPSWFIFLIGSMWLLVTLFLLVMLITGR